MIGERRDNTTRTSVKLPHPSIHLKAVKNDVFRPPMFPRVLSLLVGIGIQISVALVGTCFFLLVFFKTDTERGKVISLLLLFYVSTGTVLGYTSSRVYTIVNGIHWLSIAGITSIAIPAISMLGAYTLNCLLWTQQSRYSVYIFSPAFFY